MSEEKSTRLQKGYWFDNPFKIGQKRAEIFSDLYINRTRLTLEKDNFHPEVIVEFYLNQPNATYRIDETLALLRIGTGFFKEDKFVDSWGKLIVKALYNGEKAKIGEPVITVEGDYQHFCQLVPIAQKILAGRFEITEAITRDGIQLPIYYCRDDLNKKSLEETIRWGIVPEDLITVYGSAAIAASKFITSSSVSIIPVVSLDKNCINAAYKITRMTAQQQWGVCFKKMDEIEISDLNLIKKFRKKLDKSSFGWVKIMLLTGLSGLKNPNVLKAIKAKQFPIDVVGLTDYSASYEYNSRIVPINGKPKYIENPRLKIVK